MAKVQGPDDSLRGNINCPVQIVGDQYWRGHIERQRPRRQIDSRRRRHSPARRRACCWWHTLVEYSTSLDPFLMLAGFGVGSSQQVGAALRIVTQAFSGNTGGPALQSFSLAAAVPFNAVSISGGLINSSSAGSNVGLTVNTNAQSMGWHCGGGRRDQWQLLVGSGYPTDCLPVDHQHCRYSNLHH